MFPLLCLQSETKTPVILWIVSNIFKPERKRLSNKYIHFKVPVTLLLKHTQSSFASEISSAVPIRWSAKSWRCLQDKVWALSFTVLRSSYHHCFFSDIPQDFSDLQLDLWSSSYYDYAGTHILNKATKTHELDEL